MPSKKSKRRASPTSQPKAAPGCSEVFLGELARELAKQLRSGDRVVLEGPMGAGKTTFARLLLLALGVRQPPEGSPSFAIAHEYDSRRGAVIHIDFYRLRDESEIEDAGIPAYYWEREAIVVSEWLSMWPGFERSVLAAGRAWRVKLDFDSTGDPNRRDVTIVEPASR